MDYFYIEFKCIICNDLPPAVSKLYYCKTGHLVCGLCYRLGIKMCTTCHQHLSPCPLAWKFLDPEEVKYSSEYPKNGGKIVEVPSDDLHCNRCLKFPTGPINHCKNGHLVCGICCDKDNSCPKCHNGLRSCDVASKWLTGIIDPNEVEIPCEFFERGCPKLLTPNDTLDHVLNNCEYREIACSGNGLDSCGNQVVIKNFYQHLRDVHLVQEKATKNGIFSDTLVWQRFDPPTTFYGVKYDEQIFLVSRAVEKGTFYFWISVNGNDETAESYAFKLKLQQLDITGNDADSRPVVIRKAPVVPLNRSRIPSKSQMISFHYSEIIRFFQPCSVEHPVTKMKSNYACPIMYKIIKI